MSHSRKKQSQEFFAVSGSTDIKRCHKCGNTYPLSDFSKNKSEKDGLQRACKSCQKSYKDTNRLLINKKLREYYRDHPDIYSEYRRINKDKATAFTIKYRSARRELINSLKSGGCTRCGLVHECMDIYEFHHVDQKTKEKDICRLFSPTAILKESLKCMVVCANCHRIIHAEIKAEKRLV